MSELQVFANPEFGTVRTMLIDDEPWAVGKDVATALGYSNPQKAVRDHVDFEDRTVNKSFTVNGTPPTIINESGLYSLILSSKLPAAKRFKRWVTSEVLPALRKTGSYTTAAERVETRAVTTDDYLTAARILSGCRNERMPYVLSLLKKAGIEVDAPSVTAIPGRSKDPRTAMLLDVAIADYGVSVRELERRTGLHNAQIYRMRNGTALYSPERAAAIRDTIHALLPDLDIDAIYNGTT